MILKKKILLLLPAYNEEGFISKTVKNVPSYVDFITIINDASVDNTKKEAERLKKIDKRICLINNKINGGIGYAFKEGLKKVAVLNPDYIVFAAGDNQCDLSKIKDFVTICEKEGFDVCRGNRFLNFKELGNMTTIRLIGNSFYSFINKFVSGYYSLFDLQSSFSAIKIKTIKQINLAQLRDDYLFDNSLWINLNIIDARIKDIPIPVIYEDEVSDIKYSKFILSSLPYLTKSYFKRIFFKYIFILHPVGVFLITGFIFTLFGLTYGLYIFIKTLSPSHIPPTTATVMLSVVPFIVGFQLLLNAIVLDIQNEPR